MSRLVAYFGNDPERMECALFPARLALYARTPENASGWGLGFVQGGDVLLQKRPRAEATEVDFFSLAKDLHADAMIGRVGLDEDGEVFAALGELGRGRTVVERLEHPGVLGQGLGEAGVRSPVELAAEEPADVAVVDRHPPRLRADPLNSDRDDTGAVGDRVTDSHLVGARGCDCRRVRHANKLGTTTWPMQEGWHSGLASSILAE